MLAHYAGPIPVVAPAAAISLRLPALRRMIEGWPLTVTEIAHLRPGDVQREGGRLYLTESCTAALAIVDALPVGEWAYPCEIAARLKVPRAVVVDALDLVGAEAADDGSGRRLWRVA